MASLQLKIINAATKARKAIGIKKGEVSQFGDCTAVAIKTKNILLEEYCVNNVKVVGGQFVCDKDTSFDHTWLLVNDEILDPTIDMFTFDIDVDLYTMHRGVYFALRDEHRYDDRYVRTNVS